MKTRKVKYLYKLRVSLYAIKRRAVNTAKKKKKIYKLGRGGKAFYPMGHCIFFLNLLSTAYTANLRAQFPSLWGDSQNNKYCQNTESMTKGIAPYSAVLKPPTEYQ